LFSHATLGLWLRSVTLEVFNFRWRPVVEFPVEALLVEPGRAVGLRCSSVLKRPVTATACSNAGRIAFNHHQRD
jgi:hypothetical protein